MGDFPPPVLLCLGRLSRLLSTTGAVKWQLVNLTQHRVHVVCEWAFSFKERDTGLLIWVMGPEIVTERSEPSLGRWMEKFVMTCPYLVVSVSLTIYICCKFIYRRVHRIFYRYRHLCEFKKTLHGYGRFGNGHRWWWKRLHQRPRKEDRMLTTCMADSSQKGSVSSVNHCSKFLSTSAWSSLSTRVISAESIAWWPHFQCCSFHLQGTASKHS